MGKGKGLVEVRWDVFTVSLICVMAQFSPPELSCPDEDVELHDPGFDTQVRWKGNGQGC